MTKADAIQAMIRGEKVTHPSFPPEEWISMEGYDTIVTEEGYKHPSFEFWSYRLADTFKTGWSIWTPAKDTANAISQ